MKTYIPYPFFHDDVPIDISHLFESEKPAGKHGFLHNEGRDFVFEDGTKAKFWGVNFNGAACFPDHEYARVVARRLAKLGTNIVRFHQLDAQWHTPNIFNFTKGKRNVSGKLDPEAMERLDYLIWCLKEEGIYVYLDMLTYRKFRSDEGVQNAHALKDAAKPVCNYNRRLIELQKEFCRDIWTHYNPYTKLAYCDEPAIVLTEIVNECDLFTSFKIENLPEPYRTELIKKFCEWLDKKRIDASAEAKAADSNDADFTEFRIELQSAYYAEMMQYMRSLGVKIPIAGTNWNHKPGNYNAQLGCDFLDTHPYCYTDWANWNEFEKRCTSPSISQNKLCYITASGLMCHENMPTYISEWDMPWPNERRAESVVYSAALGMLQGWSGFAVHTYSYTTRLSDVKALGNEVWAQKIGGSPARQGVFATWNDPAKIGLFYYGALITRRGDVKEGKTLYKHTATEKNDWERSFFEANNIEKHRFVLDAFGTSTLPEAPFEVTDDILSDTGEMYRNPKKELGYIDTKMTKCIYGSLERNGKIEISGMSVTSKSDYAVVALTSITDKPISESDHLLLTTIGRAENTNMKFVGNILAENGEPPVVIENIEAEIELETNVSDLSVWAISAEGYYIGTVPTEYKDGKLRFSIGDTSRSMYYLIVKS